MSVIALEVVSRGGFWVVRLALAGVVMDMGVGHWG